MSPPFTRDKHGRPRAVVFRRPAFLPDPNDGSLYSLGGKNNEGLTVGAANVISALFLKDGTRPRRSFCVSFSKQKLPFTIPELVQASPCRSSDGVLYMGKDASQTGVAPLESNAIAFIPLPASNSQRPGVLARKPFSHVPF